MVNNDIYVSLFEVIRATLNYDESLIVIGRQNLKKENLRDDYIVIDFLAGIPQYRKFLFNAENQEEKIIVNIVSTFTIQFFGDNSCETAYKFAGLVNSQESLEEQRKQNISFYEPQKINNLGGQTQAGFYEMYEVELVVQYEIITVIERKALTDVELKLIGEK